jgi:dynein assembly factor 3
LLCRILLQLAILNETEFTSRERMELFFDIYANCLIRQKSQNYIDYMIRELTRLVTQDKRCKTAIGKIIDLSLLKFKERDELEEVLKSWNSQVPFDIEKYRDQRLRYHYKERYDYRLNLVDWDYQMDIAKFVCLGLNRLVSFDSHGSL